MPLTKFPRGVSSFGVPLLGSGGQIPATTGDYYFVDSGAGGTSAGRASDPDNPANTIDAAINLTTASNGDVIVVMPGHSESLTAATDVALDVAGVQIVGLGIGHTRPQLNYDNASGAVAITANNTRLSNLVFDASIASVTNGVIADNTIQHVEIDNCRWTFDATGVEFTVMLKLGNGGTDSADYVYIHDNWFEAENIDGCASAILIDDCQFVHIVNNLFTGDYNSVCIDGAASSSACLDYVIVGNVIENRDSGSFAIDLDDSATGIAAYNAIGGSAALASNADWGGLKVVENYVSDAADASGVLVPSTTAS